MTLVPSQRDLRILAATMDAEAASESDAGMIAVAQVVFNRAGNPRHPWQVGALPHMGMIEATCVAKAGSYGQFSCWNGDRAAKMRRYFVGGDPDRGWVSDSAARGARGLLREFIDGRAAPAGVERCSHYFNPALASPKWGGRVDEGVKIGRHVFLRPGQLTPPETAIQPVMPRPVRIQRERTLAEKIAQAWGVAKWAWSAIGAVALWIGDKLLSIGIDPATIDTPDILDRLPGLPSLPEWGWYALAPYAFAAAVLVLATMTIFHLRNRKERPHEVPYSTTKIEPVRSDREGRTGHDHTGGNPGGWGGEHPHAGSPRFGRIDRTLLRRLGSGS